MEYEGIQIEYKREFVDNFKYTVIAFANTEGGQIFFGINDDGSVCGITDVDKTMRRITDTVRDTIRPDVSRFTKCEAIEREGKPVIRGPGGRSMNSSPEFPTPFTPSPSGWM